MTAVLCAHADDNGVGAHWKAAGEACPTAADADRWERWSTSFLGEHETVQGAVVRELARSLWLRDTGAEELVWVEHPTVILTDERPIKVDDPINALWGLAHISVEVEEQIASRVRDARAMRRSWAQIAESLGTSEDDARFRYAR